jgi:hypothetical protein
VSLFHVLLVVTLLPDAVVAVRLTVVWWPSVERVVVTTPCFPSVVDSWVCWAQDEVVAVNKTSNAAEVMVLVLILDSSLVSI